MYVLVLRSCLLYNLLVRSTQQIQQIQLKHTININKSFNFTTLTNITLDITEHKIVSSKERTTSRALRTMKTEGKRNQWLIFIYSLHINWLFCGLKTARCWLDSMLVRPMLDCGKKHIKSIVMRSNYFETITTYSNSEFT